jgi:hypothetical protein
MTSLWSSAQLIEQFLLWTLRWASHHSAHGGFLMAKRLLSISFVVVTLVGCAAADVVPMGTNTYMISQTSAGGVFTNMGTLKSEVIQRANAFAESKGKVAIPVAARETPPAPGRMPNFEYQFQLVDRTDPRASGGGLVKTPDLVIEHRNQAPGVVVNTGEKNPPTQSKDLYAELLKLDDLRKRGIITDAEFEVQKQKLLQGR